MRSQPPCSEMNSVRARSSISRRNSVNHPRRAASAVIAFAGALSAPRIRIIDPDSYGVLASIFMLDLSMATKGGIHLYYLLTTYYTLSWYYYYILLVLYTTSTI